MLTHGAVAAEEPTSYDDAAGFVDDGADFDAKLLRSISKGIKKQEFQVGVEPVVVVAPAAGVAPPARNAHLFPRVGLPRRAPLPFARPSGRGADSEADARTRLRLAASRSSNVWLTPTPPARSSLRIASKAPGELSATILAL